MEAILIAIITGGLSLVGVIITNISSNRSIENKIVTSQAVTDEKLRALTEEVRKHNSFAERIPVLEIKVDNLAKRVDRMEAHGHDDGK